MVGTDPGLPSSPPGLPRLARRAAVIRNRGEHDLEEQAAAASGARRPVIAQDPLPPLACDDQRVPAVIEWLAAENRTWGYQRIQGELLKLGHRSARRRSAALLPALPYTPAPQRHTDMSWRQFLQAQAATTLAGQAPLDPLVPSAVVLGGEPLDERGDLGTDRRPSRSGSDRVDLRVPGGGASVVRLPGVTSRWARSLLGRSRISAAITVWSAQPSRGRGWVWRSTATSCRSTRRLGVLGGR